MRRARVKTRPKNNTLVIDTTNHFFFDVTTHARLKEHIHDAFSAEFHDAFRRFAPFSKRHARHDARGFFEEHDAPNGALRESTKIIVNQLNSSYWFY